MIWTISYYNSGLPLVTFSNEDGSLEDAPTTNVVWIETSYGKHSLRLVGYDHYFLISKGDSVWQVGGWYTTSDLNGSGSYYLWNSDGMMTKYVLESIPTGVPTFEGVMVPQLDSITVGLQ